MKKNNPKIDNIITEEIDRFLIDEGWRDSLSSKFNGAKNRLGKMFGRKPQKQETSPLDNSVDFNRVRSTNELENSLPQNNREFTMPEYNGSYSNEKGKPFQGGELTRVSPGQNFNMQGYNGSSKIRGQKPNRELATTNGGYPRTQYNSTSYDNDVHELTPDEYEELSSTPNTPTNQKQLGYAQQQNTQQSSNTSLGQQVYGRNNSTYNNIPSQYTTTQTRQGNGSNANASASQRQLGYTPQQTAQQVSQNQQKNPNVKLDPEALRQQVFGGNDARYNIPQGSEQQNPSSSTASPRNEEGTESNNATQTSNNRFNSTNTTPSAGVTSTTSDGRTTSTVQGNNGENVHELGDDEVEELSSTPLNQNGNTEDDNVNDNQIALNGEGQEGNPMGSDIDISKYLNPDGENPISMALNKLGEDNKINISQCKNLLNQLVSKKW